MIAESEFGGKVNSPNATSGPTFVSLSNNRKVDPLGARYVTPSIPIVRARCASGRAAHPIDPRHPSQGGLTPTPLVPAECNFNWC